MRESFLHYCWQYKLMNSSQLLSTDGEQVEIVDVGQLNTDAGPDFFNAKIRIGGTLWAGNIELHVNSSDWRKHQHHSDKAYDSVILHVVENADAEVIRCDGERIPQLVISIPAYVEQNYDQLLATQQWIACADKIGTVPAIFIQSWKNSLLSERLEQKMQSIETLLNDSANHWEEAFYITLARNFGFGVNSQAFELLAKSLPLAVLCKHKNDLLQLEALMLGQAGLLPPTAEDDYSAFLTQEYNFLKIKYNIQPMDASQWKLLRLRPDNFPHIRIAQFAALIHGSSKLFSKILDKPNIDYLRTLFSCEPSEYWKSHYVPGRVSVSKSKKLGSLSINGLLINTVVPFLFCFAHKHSNQELKDRAIQLLEHIPAEKNAVVSNWISLGLRVESAYDSQALLQLKNNYCSLKKCLRCRIGHKVLTLNS